MGHVAWIENKGNKYVNEHYVCLQWMNPVLCKHCEMLRLWSEAASVWNCRQLRAVAVAAIASLPKACGQTIHEYCCNRRINHILHLDIWFNLDTNRHLMQIENITESLRRPQKFTVSASKCTKNRFPTAKHFVVHFEAETAHFLPCNCTMTFVF